MALYKLLPVSPLCGSIPINLMEETMPGYGHSGGKKKKAEKGGGRKDAAMMLIMMEPKKKKAAKRPKGEKTMA